MEEPKIGISGKGLNDQLMVLYATFNIISVNPSVSFNPLPDNNI